MENNIKNTKESFQIFLEERNIPDPDELLGKALRYLKNKGQIAEFKGFNKNNDAIVEIDNTLYKFDKCFGLWQSAKFTKIEDNYVSTNSTTRKTKIESFYL